MSDHDRAPIDAPPAPVRDDVAPVTTVGRDRDAPRAGELTMGWRIVTACLWIGVVVAFAAIWNTSVQLGLSTWWLGARSDPQPQLVRLTPFVAPMLMALATFNNVRWLGRFGVVAALVTAAFGVADLGRVPELAVVELAVAGLAGLVSLASLTGTYRRAPTTPAPASTGQPDGSQPG